MDCWGSKAFLSFSFTWRGKAREMKSPPSSTGSWAQLFLTLSAASLPIYVHAYIHTHCTCTHTHTHMHTHTHAHTRTRCWSPTQTFTCMGTRLGRDYNTCFPSCQFRSISAFCCSYGCQFNWPPIFMMKRRYEMQAEVGSTKKRRVEYATFPRSCSQTLPHPPISQMHAHTHTHNRLSFVVRDDPKIVPD